MTLIGGLLGLGVSTGFCAAAARALRRWVWPDAEPGAAAVAGLLLFLVLQSLLVLIAGLAGGLSAGVLTGLALLGWGALAAFRQLPPPPRSWLPRRPPGLAEGVLYWGGGLLALSVPIKGFLFPPSIGDALTYHLPNVAEWVQARRFVFGFSPDLRTWFPMGFELVETWWAVFIHRDALLGMAGLEVLALAVAAVGTLARAHGLRPAMAMLVFAFLPMVILHSTACLSDLASAAMVLSGYALVAVRAPLSLQALPLLVGAGTKPTALFGALGVGAYFLATRAYRAPRQSWGPAAATLTAGLLLAGFWYARNWILRGHPLYPVYGSTAAQGLRPDVLESFDTLRRTLVDLPARAADPRSFSVMSADTTSWGWFVLPWGLPLTLVALRRDAGLRRLAVCFLGGWFLTLAFSPLNPLNLRFAMWFPALVALGAARAPTRATVLIAAAAGALNFAATIIPGEVHNADPFRLPPTLPRSEPIACISTGESPSYLYYNSDFSRPVSYPQSMAELRGSRVRFAVVYHRPPWLETLASWKLVEGRVYAIP